MNDVSVIRVSRCGITRGTLSGKHVLTLIWMIMIGGSFKIVSNLAVLTVADGTEEEERRETAAWPPEQARARGPLLYTMLHTTHNACQRRDASSCGATAGTDASYPHGLQAKTTTSTS